MGEEEALGALGRYYEAMQRRARHDVGRRRFRQQDRDLAEEAASG
jgi:hypothetical protein